MPANLANVLQVAVLIIGLIVLVRALFEGAKAGTVILIILVFLLIAGLIEIAQTQPSRLLALANTVADAFVRLVNWFIALF